MTSGRIRGRRSRDASLECLRLLLPWQRRLEPPPQDPARVAESLAAIDEAARGEASPSEATHEDSPVFVLATGWRTGSTVLQRILHTDGRLLLWGEPLGRSAILPRLTEALAAISAGWPPKKYWAPERLDRGALVERWVANLFPPAGDLRDALRALLEHWFAEPARRRGFARWGLKEVRLGAAEACVLHWLYPRARFLVLTRDPRDAYRSLMAFDPQWTPWMRWPDQPARCAIEFARHWNRLAESWLSAPAGMEHIFMRYEEMRNGGFDFRALEPSLGLKLDEERALARHPGASPPEHQLTRWQRYLIRREAAPGMDAFGYAP